MWIVILLLLCTVVRGDDFTTVEQRLYESFLPSDSTGLLELYESARVFNLAITSGGYWPDINYSDPNVVLWPAAAHLAPRLVTMTTAYVVPGQPYYGNASLYANIENALNFWLAKDFINPNWWWNDINITGSIGVISFLLKDHLTTKQLSECVTIMNRANYASYTGANLVWMATVQYYKGFTLNNETDVKLALNAIYGVITIATSISEGIKQDGSFYQHGQQLYSGGYGFDFTSSILPFLNQTANTSFYINNAQLAIFSLMVLDGQQWMINRGAWDWVVKGREITRDLPLTAPLNPGLIAAVGGPRHEEYVQFAMNLKDNGGTQLYGNKHYWKSDYMVHRSKGYAASVRMYSTRTYNSECVNLEGLKSLHLADGVLNIYQTGYEYEYIFPTWDWEQIPGTTCAKGEVAMSCSTLKQLGKTHFVGGVSDGTHGAAAHDFAAALNGKLVAKKSWFFFDDLIVALGAGISCGGCKFPIITSISQNLLNGKIYTSSSPNTPVPSGNHTLNGVWWVYHDNIGYIVPESKSLGLFNGNKTGTWQSIGAYAGSVTNGVFNFWINQHDGGDSYYYVIVPTVTVQELEATANETLNTLQVISNSNTLQAVYHTDLQILQAVFWQPGSLTLNSFEKNFTVTSSSPAIVMLVLSKSEISTFVSDPTQLLTEIKVSFNINLQGKACANEGAHTLLTFALPTGEFAGHSTSINCTIA